ncbi:C40 family peptidase [Hymenobacter sp. RP-2-7]|uniref:C40 family peptidase n=1 Tax=Hymenobacter polaris TaxID=2682546 RepID=A0A7Y0FN75_9BACT|nr:C40 family peptidase [Hymenobacter polaris]NML66628.1 C40 family peptidase [Hymenobacter polaris]
MMLAQNYPGPARPATLGAWLRRAAWPLLLLLLLLGTSCQRQLNQRTGYRYPSRSSGRLGAHRAPVVVKSKTKASSPGTTAGKTVVKQRITRPTSASGALATVIEAARSYQGTPYVYGGTTRGGLDCSGLLQLSFAEAGITIPRSSNEQAVWGDPIKPTELRPGDLLFFGPSPGARTITHVGLVTVVDADGVEFIHASSSLGVVENSFELDYYLSRFIRAVRPRF